MGCPVVSTFGICISFWPLPLSTIGLPTSPASKPLARPNGPPVSVGDTVGRGHMRTDRVPPDEGGADMAGEIDDAKGRMKEAAGDLTDNDELKNEGKIDQVTGKVKDVVDKLAGKLKKR